MYVVSYYKFVSFVKEKIYYLLPKKPLYVQHYTFSDVCVWSLFFSKAYS
jgi:hypothetical protein